MSSMSACCMWSTWCQHVVGMLSTFIVGMLSACCRHVVGLLSTCCWHQGVLMTMLLCSFDWVWRGGVGVGWGGAMKIFVWTQTCDNGHHPWTELPRLSEKTRKFDQNYRSLQHSVLSVTTFLSLLYPFFRLTGKKHFREVKMMLCLSRSFTNGLKRYDFHLSGEKLRLLTHQIIFLFPPSASFSFLAHDSWPGDMDIQYWRRKTF